MKIIETALGMMEWLVRVPSWGWEDWELRNAENERMATISRYHRDNPRWAVRWRHHTDGWLSTDFTGMTEEVKAECVRQLEQEYEKTIPKEK